MVAGGDSIAAHMAGHTQAFFGLAALPAPGGVRRDRPGRAVFTLCAMRCRLAAKVVPLHHAGKALALAHADHIHKLHIAKDIHIHCRAGSLIRLVLQSNLAEMALRADACLTSMANQRHGAVLGLDVIKAKLHRVVAVGLDGLHLRDVIRRGLHDGDGDDGSPSRRRCRSFPVFFQSVRGSCFSPLSVVSGHLQRTTDNGQKIISTGLVAFSASGFLGEPHGPSTE